MTKAAIEREKLKMFVMNGKRRNPVRWVNLIEAERQATRRGPPKRTTRKRRRT